MAEDWRWAPGCPGYEVSSAGRVRSWHRQGPGAHWAQSPRLMKRQVNVQTGYWVIRLKHEGGAMKTRNVHELAAEAFLGPRPTGYDVSHIDGDRTNAAAANLTYESRGDNMQRRQAHGTAGVKLTADDAVAIRAAVAAGQSQRSVARDFGVSAPTVSYIVRRITWASV